MAHNCDAVSTPSYANFVVSIIILLGILLSYLPQHHRIISRRSSEGLSPYFVLLGTTSGTCAFFNILTLASSRRDLSCCTEVSGFSCAAGLLGIAQVGVQWMCFVVILLLFLLFFPRATPLAPPAEPKSQPTYRTALLVTFLAVLHLLLVVILTVIFLYKPAHLLGWTNFLGVLATVLAAIQYFPQIYTTWRLQRVASLSIPTMCIQTPGSFVWAGSLAGRLGWDGWSQWGIYVVSGTLQGTLLTMAIVFEIRDRGSKKGGIVEETDNERTALLGDGT